MANKNYKCPMKHSYAIKELLIAGTFILSISHASAQTIQDQEMIKPRKQATLPEGHIYLPYEKLTIVKDMSNGQRRIHIEISNTYVREREIHVFLKTEEDELPDLITGTYELFLTSSALTLTNRTTGKKVVFEINGDINDSNTHIKHGNAKVVHAIRIATYFKTCPRL
jgi:hypothetical protein